nr:hypothetical protein Iba_scaffold10073CG0460 [Ipomoea batatas]
MLVSRKERRNRFTKPYYPNEGPAMERTQAPRTNQTEVGAATQSRFAALENLEDSVFTLDQENMQGRMNLQQPASSLPRIRTNENNKQRSPRWREPGPSYVHRSSPMARQPQPAHRGGHQSANYSGFQTGNRGGYQNAFRAGLRSDGGLWEFS